MLRAALLAVLLLPQLAQATTRTVCSVGCDHPTISQALDAAVDGDTIVVGPGEYAESVNITRSVVLQAEEGSDTPWILGVTEPSLRVEDGAVATIRGLRVGTTGRRAMQVRGEGTVATFEDVVVQGVSSGIGGTGLRVQGGATAFVVDSHFEDLSNTNGGGCLRVNEGASLTVTDSVLAGCSTLGEGGAVLLEGADASVHLVGVSILDSQSGGLGGAVTVRQGGLLLQDSTVTGGRTTGSHGGCLALWDGATGTVLDSELSGCTAEWSGGGAAVGASTLIMQGGALLDNLAHDHGGAVLGWEDPTLSFEEVLIARNATQRADRHGGGIASWGGSLALVDTDLEDNTATNGGGGLLTAEATFTMTGGALSRNQAANGGQIFAVNSDNSLDGVLLEHGVATASGGGLFAIGGSLQAQDTVFAHHQHLPEVGAGGGLHVHDCPTHLQGVTFLANQSGTSGGGLFVGGASSVTLVGSDFTDNAAHHQGGAVGHFATEGDLVVQGSAFHDNHAIGWGGAIAAFSPTSLTVEASLFEGNEASHGAGAVMWWREPVGGTAAVTGSVFARNRAVGDGGAGAILLGRGTGATLLDNQFIDNVAEAYRGGAFRGITLSTLEARRNMFCGQQAQVTGGAVALQDVGGTAHAWTNNRFIDNAVGTGLGGGLFSDNGAEIRFNTFVGHEAGAGGAAWLPASTDFSGNLVAYTLSGDGVHQAGGTSSYNLFFDNTAAHTDSGAVLTTGNLVDEDPLFLSYAPGDGCEADLRPRPGSPLIDGGPSHLTDLDDTRSDIGAFGGPDADPAWWADGDGDGWPWVYDCDDDDPDVHPGATSYCDGIDNNCDGVVDGPDSVDQTTWWPDADGDGFGDMHGEPIVSCEQPEGHVDNNLDCNDDDELIHPDAISFCDGIDNNCDGVIDGPDSVDAGTWYEDADGDGFGNALFSVVACDQPEGFVSHDDGRPFDCDDTDPDIYPGAPEICDGLDRNCNGVPDDPLPEDAPWWWPDADGDGFGDPDGEPVQACDQPEGYADNDLDCDDDDPLTWPGAPEICNGQDNSCSGVPDDPLPEDAPWWWPDADGDGFGDADGEPVQACEQPEGYVDNDLDCDDDDPNVYPGAPEPENDCDHEPDPVDPDEDRRAFDPAGLSYGGSGCGCQAGGLGGVGLLPLLLVGLLARRRPARG